MESSDLDLLMAWRDGDRRAGGELISRFYRPLYRFFANKVGDANVVEDLVQRTFTGATVGLERFRVESSARTWMFAIARNILRQWFEERYRTRKHEGELGEASVADLGVGPSTLVALDQDKQRLLTALQRLPLESQLILELSYWEGLTARELGEILGCPEGTARSRLRKAKQELRGVLDELARTPELIESTMRGLETWAADIKAAWQG